MFVVLVRFTVSPGHEDAFLTRVREQARASLAAESDCLQFDVCHDGANRSYVLLYEVYASEPAFAAHLTTPHFLAFDEATRPWVAAKTVERWHRV